MTDQERKGTATAEFESDPVRPERTGQPASSIGSRDAMATPPDPAQDELSPEPHFEETLVEEISNLADDGMNYARAEVAFQKTRAALAGKSAGMAAVFLIVALVTFHIALLAFAVGMVMALAPLVTIWGAIAIVVGVLLLITVWLALKAKRQADKISALFANPEADAAGAGQ